MNIIYKSMNIIYKSHRSSFRKAYPVRSAWFNWALSTQQIQMPRPFESQRILVQCHPVWRSCPAMRLPTSSCVGRHKLGNHLSPKFQRKEKAQPWHNTRTTLSTVESLHFQPCTCKHCTADFAVPMDACKPWHLRSQNSWPPVTQIMLEKWPKWWKVP
jgi:hypothetical protein